MLLCSNRERMFSIALGDFREKTSILVLFGILLAACACATEPVERSTPLPHFALHNECEAKIDLMSPYTVNADIGEIRDATILSEELMRRGIREKGDLQILSEDYFLAMIKKNGGTSPDWFSSGDYKLRSVQLTKGYLVQVYKDSEPCGIWLVRLR